MNYLGVIIVRESTFKDFEVNVKLNGFEAQKCAYPFTYKAQEYESCTTADQTYEWCSPTSQFTNQILKCQVTSEILNGTCPGEAFDSNMCGHGKESSGYDLRFTTCPSQPVSVNALSTEFIYFDTNITINGIGFSSVSCENEVYIGKI